MILGSWQLGDGGLGRGKLKKGKGEGGEMGRGHGCLRDTWQVYEFQGEEYLSFLCLVQFVLVEGAPGVGKSTFAWEACRKWGEGEILEDFELVILIKLRDASIRNATCLRDLIQYPCDPAVREKVIDRITKSGGEKVLLLLEGYDELPALLRNEESIFTKVINGDQFDVGTVGVKTCIERKKNLGCPHRVLNSIPHGHNTL